jgi:transcriptional regulator with XRE-family HTH domain
MAAALGITQTGYSRYESGAVPLTVPALVRICGVLDVRVDDVLAMVLGGG